TPTDTLIGIATSRRTPYVLSALSYARAQGALAPGPVFISPREMREKGDCEVVVECVVGGEVLMGSTRMKAGSGTKMILNMISMGIMICLGKTYRNLMIDLKPTNTKLLLHAVCIFCTILPHSPLSDQEIEELVGRCGGSLKIALVIAWLRCGVEEARGWVGGWVGLGWVEGCLGQSAS
ncbi:hypothetical protein BDQ17DRAFT_1259635, partial [Cyathus striatus]